jgi:hypothetical protein
MEQTNDNSSYAYETKCRRCGQINEFHYPASGIDEVQFFNIMNKYIQAPQSYSCTLCKKATVQDVVSYSTSEESIDEVEMLKTRIKELEQDNENMSIEIRERDDHR